MMPAMKNYPTQYDDIRLPFDPTSTPASLPQANRCTMPGELPARQGRGGAPTHCLYRPDQLPRPVGLEQVFRLIRTWCAHMTIRRALRNGSTSLTPTAGPSEWPQALNLEYWALENGLHQVKVVTHDQEQSTSGGLHRTSPSALLSTPPSG